jgi:hypothetical protein
MHSVVLDTLSKNVPVARITTNNELNGLIQPSQDSFPQNLLRRLPMCWAGTL